MPTCSNCGNETAAGAVFCDQCGAQLSAPGATAAEAPPAPAGGSTICPACGAGNVPGEAFCDFCGSPLEAPAPAVEEMAVSEPAAAEVAVEAEPAATAPAGEGEAAPAAEGQPTCPACGAAVLPDEAFCGDCGASLAGPAAEEVPAIVAGQVPEAREAVEPAAEEVPPTADRQVPEAREIVEPAAEEVPPTADRQVPEAREIVEPAAEEAPATLDRQVPEAREIVEPAAEEAPATLNRQVPEARELAEPAVEAAVLEAVAAPSPTPVPAEVPTCPACGIAIEVGDKFCSNCGAVLLAEPAPVPAAAPPPPSLSAGPRLVVEVSGAEIPLPAAAEILIGREDPVSGVYPDVDLTPHGGEEGGVSRQHARLIIEGASYFVEDLDSTNYTFVNKQKLAPRTRHALNDGDELRCGRVALVLKT